MGAALRSSSFSSGTGTSRVGTEPAGATENDILYMWFVVDAASSAIVDPSGGWTLLNTWAGTSAECRLYRIRRGSGAPGYTITWTTSVYAEMHITCWSGIPADVTPERAATYSAVREGAGTGVNPPEANVPGGIQDGIALAFGQHWSGDAGAGWSAPAQYTIVRGAEVVGQDLMMAYNHISTVGNADPGTFGGGQATVNTIAEATIIIAGPQVTPATRPRVHWHRFEDSFNRADGNIAGSTSSDGKFSWTETEGTAWVVGGNEADCTAGGVFNVARTTVDTFTDDIFAEFTLIAYTRGGGSTLNVGLAIRLDGAGGGYGVEIGVNGGTGLIDNKIYHFDDDTVLDTDTTVDPENLGRLRVEARGSTIRALMNGVEFMSVTDTKFRGGVGTRRAAMLAFGVTAVSVDNFVYGDLNTGGRIIRPRRSRDGMLNLGWLDPKRWF